MTPEFIAKNRGTSTIKAVADTATSRVTVLVDPAPLGLGARSNSKAER